MVQKRIIFLLFLVGLALLPSLTPPLSRAEAYTSPAVQGFQCPGALPSRMRVNQPGKVVTRNGTNLRESPSRSASLLGGLPENATFTVIGGPICADNFTWWEVLYENRIGWTAEGNSTDYWIESLAPRVARIENGAFTLELEGRVAQDATFERKTRFPLRTASGVEFMPLEHVRFSLNMNEGDSGEIANISIFQTPLFSPLVDGLEELTALLQTRPDYLDMFSLPQSLPAVDMQRVLISQPAYVNFNGGTGLRFIGHFTYQAGFVPPDEIYYVFLGLTDDSSYYVQAFLPIRANFLPPQPPEDFDRTPYTGYMLSVQSLLDTAASSDFTPGLNALDSLMRNLVIRIDSPTETVAARYESVRFTVDRRLASGARGQDFPAADPFTSALPLPAHVEFTLNGVPQMLTGQGTPVGHIAVFPAERYNFLFIGAVDTIRSILRSGNPTPDIPDLLPVIDRRRRVAAAVRYVDFVDGTGIRFLAAFTPDPMFITSADVAYVYIGLTDDGESLVQVVVPVSADVLLDNPPADLDMRTFLDTYETYVQDVERQLNNAEPWQFTPRLDTLDALVQSIRVE